MKKKTIIIELAIVLIIIILGVGGYFGYKYIEESKTTGAEWGDTYVTYLEEAKQTSGPEKLEKYGIYEGVENATIKFYQIEEESDPSMVIKYDLNGTKFFTVWDINKEQNVPDMKIDVAKDDIRLLYNIEKQKYEWYFYKDSDGNKLYTEVIPTDETSGDGKVMHKVYDFKKEDLPKNEEVKEGEIPTISKFEETFIEPTIKESKEIEINLNADSKEIKKAVTETVKEYKSQEQGITEEVKSQVEEKKTELNNKKEIIKKAEEEKAKKEAEEKAAAEAEAAKKAAEEAAKGLTVGSHKLKYGTYKSDVSKMDSTMYGTITLNPNGTFHIKANCEGNYPYPTLNCDGTYKVGQVENSGSYSTGIHFTTSTGVKFMFEVLKDNAFSDQWHGYSYSGN